ncbi:MAG: response regulator [Crocinitomicaceae bacterium]|nr:response regulator [Crocinitomicaceae bacterium]
MSNTVIAVIEDSGIIKEIVSTVLEKETGASIIGFSSAESAIQQLDVYNPDLILLDYNLDSVSPNNMDGIQFLNKLKFIGKSIPIIMISGQRDKRITADALKLGVVSYESKENEDFLDNIVIEVNKVLDVLKLNKKQKRQRADLNKRILRISAFILVPVMIVLTCLFCQS